MISILNLVFNDQEIATINPTKFKLDFKSEDIKKEFISHIIDNGLVKAIEEMYPNETLTENMLAPVLSQRINELDRYFELKNEKPNKLNGLINKFRSKESLHWEKLEKHQHGLINKEIEKSNPISSNPDDGLIQELKDEIKNGLDNSGTHHKIDSKNKFKNK